MQKLEINNDLNLEVFINDNFDLSKIPKTETDLIVSLLESEIFNLFNESLKRKKYYENTKNKKPP